MTATQVRRIDEVAVVFNGKTPSKSEQRGSGHPVLKIKDIDELGRFRGTFSGHVGIDLAQKHVKQQLAGGETLVLNAAHSVTHVASKTFYADQEVAGSLATGEWLIVRWSTEMVDSRFGNHWINAPDTRFRIRHLVKGIHLYPKDVARLQIPLPPLDEQKRIAGILDAADALRAKRREALAQLDTLLQSTFLDMFGDPVTNPMGWTKVRSGELFLLPPKIGTITPAAGRGYLVVRVGEVGESRIAFERCGRVEISEKDFAKFRLERGDTVIARAIGTKNLLGKASFFADFDEATVIDSHVMRLRPDPIKCDGLWFYSLISSDRGKVLLQQTGGATAVQFNINAKQASSMQVALPPLDLQHRFAAIVESVEQQKLSQRAHLAELDTLFASLQSRAFQGDL